MTKCTVYFEYSDGDCVEVPTRGRAKILELRYDEFDGQSFLCELEDGEELVCTKDALEPWTEEKS